MLGNHLKKDWYANVLRQYYSDQDTLILYPVIDSMNRHQDIMHWEYLSSNKFRPIRIQKPTGGLDDLYIFEAVRWQCKNGYLSIIAKKLTNSYYISIFSENDSVYKVRLIRKENNNFRPGRVIRKDGGN